jgi:nitroreductase
MNLKDALVSRRSVRSYTKEPVVKDTIVALLRFAEEAPSAGNLRSRRYFVVTNPQMRKALSIASYDQEQVESAPVLIVVCADVSRSAGRYGDRGSLFSIQDATASTMCLLLSAHDMGLGACWNGAFDDQIVKDVLNLKEDVLPIAIISIGWPAENPSAPPKRDLYEVVSWID